LYRRIGVPKLEAQSLNNISITHSLQKQYQQAISTLNEELKLRQTLKDKTGEAQVKYQIAINQRKLGKTEAALSNIQAAIDIVENIRGNVKNSDLRTSYFATVQGYYKFYIDLLMELGEKNPGKKYDELALNISERSRARTLNELLTQSRTKLTKGVDPKLIESERNLQTQITSQETLLSQHLSQPEPSSQRIETTKENLVNLRNQQKEIDAKIRSQNPERAELTDPQATLKLPEIQQQLDKDTVLLQYSIGEERSYLWAITPTSFSSHKLPGRKEIKIAIEKFKGISNSKGFDDGVIQAANKFSQMLLAPVAEKIVGKRLVIVADGALQTIPFAALPDLNSTQIKNVETQNFASLQSPYQPLIINHEIVNLPSATTIAIQRRKIAKRHKSPQKTLAILADPVYSATDVRVTGKPESNQLGREMKLNSIPQAKSTKSQLTPELEIERSILERSAKNLNRNGWFPLPNTKVEAEAILKIFQLLKIPSTNSLQALSFDATYNWATNPVLSQFRILHFATYGFVDNENQKIQGLFYL
jgi:CHAT domain-containing protein